MKYWAEPLMKYSKRRITAEDLRSNPQLRKFKHIRLMFTLLNLILSLLVVMLILLEAL